MRKGRGFHHLDTEGEVVRMGINSGNEGEERSSSSQ